MTDDVKKIGRRDLLIGTALGLIGGYNIGNHFGKNRKPSGQFIYLVRHAEKQSGDNPSLTQAGQERAELLRDKLLKARIDDIYSSDYARTRETAAPLAEALGKTVRIYDPRDLDGLANEIKYFGRNVLVVGHSNTTPQLAAKLGTGKYGPIDDASEYNRLYKILRRNDRATSVLERYGAGERPAPTPRP